MGDEASSQVPGKPEQTAEEAASSLHGPSPIRLRDRRTGSWPVVAIPLGTIALAAIGGQYVGTQATVAVVTAGVAGICGVGAYLFLGRQRRWHVAVVVSTIAAVAIAGGLLWPRSAEVKNQPLTSPESTFSTTTTSSGSYLAYAGRKISQQDISAVDNFRGADLRGARLEGLDLRRIDFSGAIATGASFEASQLERALFRGTDLAGANLRRTCLRDANLAGADLTGADADGADITNLRASPDGLAVALRWPNSGSRSTACRPGTP